MAVVAHPIFLVSHGVFAFTRFMAVVSTLALALMESLRLSYFVKVLVGSGYMAKARMSGAGALKAQHSLSAANRKRRR